MALGLALMNSLTGLRFTGQAVSLTASNVSNASNPSYVRKTISAVTQVTNGDIAGVKVGAVTRELDLAVQRTLRKERAGLAYATERAGYLERLDQLYGAPGSANALDTVFNSFRNSIQELQTSPESDSARFALIGKADVLAQKINGLAGAIQDMRTDAERSIGEAVEGVNVALTRLEAINGRMFTANPGEASTAALLDERDALMDELATYGDFRFSIDKNQAVTVYAGNGNVLLGATRTQLAFDGRSRLTSDTLYDQDPTKRKVGTISRVNASGDIDLIAAGVFSSGKIGALIELRDQTLVKAQSQLDELASHMVAAIGDREASQAVAPTGPGGPKGFDLNLSGSGGGTGLLDGNEISLTVTLGGRTQSFTFKRVDDPGAVIADTLTADPNDRVVRLSGSSAADHAARIQTTLDDWATANGHPAGSFAAWSNVDTIRILGVGPGGAPVVDDARARMTETGFAGGHGAAPLFTDRQALNGLYTGRVTTAGQQSSGLAGRLAVSADVKADPARLVVMSLSPLTAPGDPTRPSHMLSRLTETDRFFSPAGGIGSGISPYSGTVGDYLTQIIATQGGAAQSAAQIQEGQQVVVTSLQVRFDEDAAVSIDQEMSNLVQLQNAYGANARVMSVVRELFNLLQQM